MFVWDVKEFFVWCVCVHKNIGSGRSAFTCDLCCVEIFLQDCEVLFFKKTKTVRSVDILNVY